MDNLIILLTMAGVAAIGIMSPGPDFIAVSHAAVSHTRRQAAAVALGVILGNGLWACAALFGVSTLFLIFPMFFMAFKIGGALFLMWLGIKMLIHAKEPIAKGENMVLLSLSQGFRKGLLTTTANPKAAIYYASALTAVAPANASIALLTMMIGIVLLICTLWYSTIVVLLSSKRITALYKRAKVYLESFFGIAIFTFGGRQLIND